jgi:beta-xylosidase
VLYFAATTNWNSEMHCIGTAVSSSINGPYQPSDQVFACDDQRGGSIDPSGFVDPATGARYVVYKIDGNSLGDGGPCRNEFTKLPTPIMLQQVGDDGVSLVGGPIQILDRSDLDGPLIEAPSLAVIGGQYYLFFSSNCWNTDLYDVSFAVADSVSGPYTKRGPMLLTGDMGLSGPGGAGVSPDGNFIAFHAGPVGDRSMYTAQVQYNGGTEITLCTQSVCKSAS